MICCVNYLIEFPSADTKQTRNFVFCERYPGLRLVKQVGECRVGLRLCVAGWRQVSARNVGGEGIYFAMLSGSPAVFASIAAAIRMGTYGQLHSRIKPAVGISEITWINRQACNEFFAGIFACTAQRIELRPRSFRVDMIGSHRRYPAPVVDARC